MNNDKYINPKNSLVLFELSEHLEFLTKLYTSKKFPKVLMLSGKKGIGKFTLINHFLNFVYNNEKYDLKNKTIDNNSSFYKTFDNNSFSNIIYLPGSNYKNIKIEDIRYLKSQLLKTTILNKERFVILDDIELFNINSLNALLKIIEEPTINNFFILINNKAKPLIDTIYSRSLEFKINLTNIIRINIIEALIKKYNLSPQIDYKYTHLTPGNFLSFNDIIIQNDILIDDLFLKNISKIFILYKKNKDLNLINFSLFLTDYYFQKEIKINVTNIEKIIEKKSFVINNINKFIVHNLNQNSLINALNSKLYNE